MRLIDADVLKEWIENWFTMNRRYHPYSRPNSIPTTELIDIIDRMPTVDAVPIIRCKDCKHFHYDMPYLIQGIPVLVHEICTFWGDGCKTSENEFCSHAERRQDD